MSANSATLSHAYDTSILHSLDMAQTRDGALKIAAKKSGVTVDEYLAFIEAGQKWCTGCKAWHPKERFGKDVTRWDGLAAKCRWFCAGGKEPNLSASLREYWDKKRPTFVSPLKGRRMSEKGRANCKAAAQGRPGPMVGRKHTIASRRKMSESMRLSAKRGPENHNFKHGRTAETRGVRFSAAYARWRYDVFARDKFTCQQCGDNRGGNLNAHHVKPFAAYPDLRFVLDNGITLCESCHKSEHRKSGV